jgi:small GTP-binding protein
MIAMQPLSKKVCMLGDFAVGKTSLVRRFVYDLFDDRYLSTVGVKVSRKPITILHPERVVDLTMMLWDLAGSEKFDEMRGTYLRGAAGALLVYDLTRQESLASAGRYAVQLRQINPNAALVIVGNKADLIAEAASNRALLEGTALADSWHAPFLATSARSGLNVEEAFRQLGQLLTG